MPAPDRHLWAEYATAIYAHGMKPARPGHRPLASG